MSRSNRLIWHCPNCESMHRLVDIKAEAEPINMDYSCTTCGWEGNYHQLAKAEVRGERPMSSYIKSLQEDSHA